jgi:hypothetical protein
MVFIAFRCVAEAHFDEKVCACDVASVCVCLACSLSLLNVIRLGLRYNSVNAKQITETLCAHTFFGEQIQVGNFLKSGREF